MAAKFRKIDPRIWHDERFRRLTPEDKLLAVYCLTCSQCNRIGYFHLSFGLASESIGYPCQGLAKGIKRICDTLRWRYDEASGVLFFPTWWKYNGECGAKTMEGNMKDLHDVPQSYLLKEFESNTRYLSEKEISVVARVCQEHGMGFDVSLAGAGAGAGAETGAETGAEKKTLRPPVPDLPFQSEEFASAWAIWSKHRSEKRQPITPTAMSQQFARLKDMGEDRAIAALLHSTANGYQGLYEPNGNGKRQKTLAEEATENAKAFLGENG